jgi:hypothetical protein
VELPGDLGPVVADYEGPVRFSRRFHCPTGLTPGARVDLVLAGLPPQANIELNGQLLTAANPSARDHFFDITPHLAPLNLFALHFDFQPDQSVSIEVRLEIHPPGDK